MSISAADVGKDRHVWRVEATRIAAIVAALALGTTFLAVQVGEPSRVPVPAAAPASESWVTVTGTQNLLGGDEEAMLAKWRNMSDPRLEGDVRITFEENYGVEDIPATYWSTVTVTNDEGSWQGQSIGFSGEDGSHHHTGWFEGDGAYEGLVFIQQLTEANPDAPSAGWDLDVVGLVYEGELPPPGRPALDPVSGARQAAEAARCADGHHQVFLRVARWLP